MLAGEDPTCSTTCCPLALPWQQQPSMHVHNPVPVVQTCPSFTMSVPDSWVWALGTEGCGQCLLPSPSQCLDLNSEHPSSPLMHAHHSSGPAEQPGPSGQNNSSGSNNGNHSNNNGDNRSSTNTEASGSGGEQDKSQYFEVLGLKISKDDLITITLAVAISYGIRW